MISSKDRSGWFGASDTDRIVGNWNTKTFEDWWAIKEGIKQNNYESESMNAGTHWEHRILEALNIPIEKDKQILIPEFKLRVNLDGNTSNKIYEIKTYKYENGFKVPLKYKRQVWVQLFSVRYVHSTINAAEIVSYGLTKNDFKNYLAEIDMSRMQHHEIEYNNEFIENLYLPRLKYLSKCLEQGIYPDESEV